MGVTKVPASLGVAVCQGAPTLEKAILWGISLDEGIRLLPEGWSGFVLPTDDGYLVTIETGYTEEEEREMEEIIAQQSVPPKPEPTGFNTITKSYERLWLSGKGLRSVLRDILGVIRRET